MSPRNWTASIAGRKVCKCKNSFSDGYLHHLRGIKGGCSTRAGSPHQWTNAGKTFFGLECRFAKLAKIHHGQEWDGCGTTQCLSGASKKVPEPQLTFWEAIHIVWVFRVQTHPSDKLKAKQHQVRQQTSS